MSKSGRERPYHWGRPNPDYTGPKAASSRTASHLAAVEAAKSDFGPIPPEPEIPEDPMGPEYDRAPDEPLPLSDAEASEDLPLPPEPEEPEDPLGRAYDHSPVDPPEFPGTGEDYDPAYAAEYARQALNAVAVHHALADPAYLSHGDTGTDGRSVVMTFVGDDDDPHSAPVGYGTFDEKGRLDSRDGEPALVRLNGTLEWFRGGVLHREDGPAVKYADPDTGRVHEVEYRNGVRVDGDRSTEAPSAEDVRAEYDEHLDRIGMD